ncbi:MAG: class I SAM-dependent methyltransferase [Lachnospiraceae bacterium]
MNQTIAYYNSNAEQFYDATVNADMCQQYDAFETYLFPGADILDCGCGSGRDSLYFLNQGYRVTAIDGSKELCKKARKLTGLPVKTMLFQEMTFEREFDAIWACASLVHVAAEELLDVFQKLTKALRERGIIYVSFKYGTFQGERNGRFFTDLNDASFEILIGKIPELQILQKFISTDVRPGREEEKWLNVVLKKRRC